MQAQRIAYGDTTIDQACTQNYPKTYSGSTSSRQLLADFQDAMRVQAGAVLPAECQVCRASACRRYPVGLSSCQTACNRTS
jgi:hypothetical protein